MKNIKPSKEQASKTINDTIIDFLEINNIKELISEIIIFAKEHSITFSTISVLTTTVLFWFIRALGYAFQLGAFNVYHISKNYIEINDNYFLQLMLVVSMEIISLLSCYIYAHIATRPDKTIFRLKRKFKIIIFLLVEMVLTLLFGAALSNSGVLNTIKTIIESRWETNIALFIIMLLLVLMINIYGIQIAIYHNKRTQGKKSDNKNISNTKNANPITRFIIKWGILMALLLVGAYGYGYIMEKQKHDFKIIMAPINSEEYLDNKYVVMNGTENPHIINPIIFENKDIYIISRLYIDDDTIHLDRNYQKIIEKQDWETFYIDNIYNILP